MLFSRVNFLLCVLRLTRAFQKIYMAALLASGGSYFEAIVCLIESGILLWSERRWVRVMGDYLAKKSYRFLVICRNLVNRSSNQKDDMD